MNASNPFNTALFYKNTHLSDCKLAIVDEAADVDITQEVLSDSIVLPVHRVLLAASSTVFDNVFLVDSPQPIHLLKVPLSYFKAAEMFIYALYHRRLPQSDDLTVQQAVRVIKLADQYNAKVVLDSCEEYFATFQYTEYMTSDSLISWEDVISFYELLPQHLTNDRLTPVHTTTKLFTHIVMMDFMRFEAAMADVAKRNKFLQLPFAAVEAVVRQQDLLVASENSVARAIMDWIAHVEPRAQQLLKHIRLNHVSPAFVPYLCAHSSPFAQHITPQDVALAAYYRDQPNHVGLPPANCSHSRPRRHPVRNGRFRGLATIQLSTTTGALRSMVQQALQQSSDIIQHQYDLDNPSTAAQQAPPKLEASVRFNGYDVVLRLVAVPSQDEPGCHLLVQLEPRGPAAAGTSLPVHPRTIVADTDIKVGDDSSVTLHSQPLWNCEYENVVVAPVKYVDVAQQAPYMHCVLAALVEAGYVSEVQDEVHGVAVVPGNVPVMLSCRVMACE